MNTALKAILLLSTLLLGFMSANAIAAKTPPMDTCRAYYDYVQDPANPLKIAFTDRSQGSIFSYWWDFGDGTFSEEQNPVHLFPDSSTYQVCLTINAPQKFGCTDTHCDSIQVPVPSNCFTTFTALNDDEYPFKVFFTSYPGPDVESLKWTFGDGTTSTEWNPVHIYSDTGFYMVTLRAFNHHNPLQCNYLYRDSVRVEIDPCISDFHYTQDPYNPRKFNFYNLAAGPLNAYLWTFGDGRSSSLPNPQHIFADTGVFNVCLRVGNYLFKDYCFDSICKPVTANVVPCMAEFTYTVDSLYPLKVKFQNRSLGAPDIFQWSFGDGNFSNEVNPNHNYLTTGSYNPCLYIYNTMFPEYCRDTVCNEINLPSIECSANFHYVLDSLNPLQVKFFADVTGVPDLYYWDFGDGLYSSSPNPLHLFPDTGDYKVVLHIINSGYPELCDDVATKMIRLRMLHNPHAAFTYQFDSLNISPNVFNFTDISNTNQPVYWHWDFGDGNTSSTQNPVHHFAPLQNYKVCMTVTDFIPPFFLLPRTACRNIQSFAYYDLGGSIFDGQYPINNPVNEGDTATVKLYRKYDNNIMVPLKSGNFHHLGYYWFSQVLGGEYVVKAELTSRSNQNGKFFPTYAYNKTQWQTANPIILDQNKFDAHVRLVPKPNIGSGPCSISGIAVEVSHPQAIIGKPAMDATVLLFNFNNQLLDYYITKKDGLFQFQKLPYGNYYVVPDVPGRFFNTDSAYLTPTNLSKNNVLLKLWQYVVGTGINQLSKDESIRVFPNPANENITLLFDIPVIGEQTIQVYNPAGQMLVKESIKTGQNQITVDISKLSGGIYFVRVIHNGNPRVLKFIKN